MEHYSALRRKEIPPHAIVQMNQRHCAKWNTPVTKKKIICDFTYILLRVVKFIEVRRIMVARARGEGRVRDCCLMDTQCKLEKVKKFVGNCSNVNALNARGTVHSQMDKVVKMFCIYYIYLYWNIVVSHCYASLCYTARESSHLYTYIPPTFLDFPCIYAYRHWVEFPVGAVDSPLVSFIHSSVYVNPNLPVQPPATLHSIQMFVFYVCVLYFCCK